MSLTNSTWSGIIKLFPPWESLVSDILAGDGKKTITFFTVYAPPVSTSLNWKRSEMTCGTQQKTQKIPWVNSKK
jgi:hypothetical protein